MTTMRTVEQRDEDEILERFAEAWNLFLKLPAEHPDDVEEFNRAIHVAQNVVLARAGLRLRRQP